MFTVFLVLSDRNVRQKTKHRASATQRRRTVLRVRAGHASQPSRIELPARGQAAKQETMWPMAGEKMIRQANVKGPGTAVGCGWLLGSGASKFLRRLPQWLFLELRCSLLEPRRALSVCALPLPFARHRRCSNSFHWWRGPCCCSMGAHYLTQYYKEVGRGGTGVKTSRPPRCVRPMVNCLFVCTTIKRCRLPSLALYRIAQTPQSGKGKPRCDVRDL